MTSLRELYKKGEANYPRTQTDVFFSDYNNVYSYSGFIDKAFRFIEDFQLTDAVLWRRFVQQFREDADYDSGWRGEYWGKMMRGACFVYSYTKNAELYAELSKTVRDMIESADSDGRISSYGRDHEFDAWDMWGRKYVMLGMQYFIEICADDDFINRIIAAMCRHADYIMSKIGKSEDGKIPITAATHHWRGANSSSVLEPFVRLYSLTFDKKYLDFSKYIVESGVCDVENLFELAYEDELYPYQYPVTKAYEITSCFEGLIEYYRITKTEKYKQTVIRYADKILKSDFTIIGCSGCTHELFDHSTVRQANTDNGKIMQETCVTVTLMKFMYQLTLLTGDPKYVDAFETSLYNAYLGSVNTEKVTEQVVRDEHPDWCIEPLPFDSYSPLTAGTRGNGIGGLKLMSDNHYYGCCACIGAAGIGLVPKMQLMTQERGFVMNLYINGVVSTVTPEGKAIVFDVNTQYPAAGSVMIKIRAGAEENFEIKFRIPDWSKTTSVKLNGESIQADKGYTAIERVWKDGDTVGLEFDMRTQAIYPIPYGTQVLMNKVIWGHNYMVPTFDREDPIAHKHIALRRGPVVLAQDNRLGYSVDDPVSIAVNSDGYVDAVVPEEHTAPYEHITEVSVPLKNGTRMTLTDYASAGKLWNEQSKMAAWILTE